MNGHALRANPPYERVYVFYVHFANKLIEALRSKGGDDGVLTFGELFSYIERVTPAPTSGGFGRNQPGSDFLFITPKE